MKEILISIFKEFGFFADETSGEALFFQKEGKEKVEYYLVMFLDKKGLEQYNSDSLTYVQQLLLAKKQAAAASDIDKNASLLICVEFDNYQGDCPRYKNMMLQIEEDEYSYKKYLLPYTAKALESFRTTETVKDQLNTLVANEENFQQFSEHIYANEAYFFAVQTFLKLPFLNLVISEDKQFITISQLLAGKLSTAELQFMNQKLVSYPMENIGRDQLLAAVVDPRSDAFNEFFNTFSSDDPAS
jgi:hypothetical protein